MSSAWLKKRFNSLRRFSGLKSKSSTKLTKIRSASASEGCLSVNTNIKNDLETDRRRIRWDRDEKNAYRDYSKGQDRYLVEKNTYDPRLHENKVCNVNVCRLSNNEQSLEMAPAIDSSVSIDSSEFVFDLAAHLPDTHFSTILNFWHTCMCIYKVYYNNHDTYFLTTSKYIYKYFFF